jgi:hypothetical protein
LDAVAPSGYKKPQSACGHWQATEERTHNVVLYRKFGSKRVPLAGLDDWNLFQILVSSDE